MYVLLSRPPKTEANRTPRAVASFDILSPKLFLYSSIVRRLQGDTLLRLFSWAHKRC